MIQSVDVDYEVSKYLERYWFPTLYRDGSSVISTCDSSSASTCTENSSYVASGLSLSSFSVGFECLDTSFYNCAIGSGVHAVYASVFGGSFGLFESPVVVPVVSVDSGLGFGGSGPFNGSETVSVDASDARGVKQASVVVDGAEVVSGSFLTGCDFTVAAQPCADLSGEELTVDTSGLDDGSHTVYVTAQDAAGNEGVSDSWTVITDNTAPIAPSTLNITADSSGTVNASWGLPSGQVSDISKAFYKICDPSGSCGAYTQADTTTSLSTTVSNPTSGDYTLYVYLQDAAGNSDTTFPAIKTFNLINTGTGTVTDTTTPTVTGTTATPTTTTTTDTTTTAASKLKITSSKRYKYKKRWLIKTKGTCKNIATGTKIYLTHTPKYKKKLRSKYRVKKTGKCKNQKFTIKTRLSKRNPYKKFKTFKTKALTKTPKHTTTKTTKTSKKKKTKRKKSTRR